MEKCSLMKVEYTTECSPFRLTQVKSIAEGEHSAILSTFIELPFVNKPFVLSILAAVLHKFSCITTNYIGLISVSSYVCSFYYNYKHHILFLL